MTVIVTLSTNEHLRLDRRLSVEEVAARINDGRARGKLIQFPNDATPSRSVYIDPNQVVSIRHDGYV